MDIIDTGDAKALARFLEDGYVMERRGPMPLAVVRMQTAVISFRTLTESQVEELQRFVVARLGGAAGVPESEVRDLGGNSGQVTLQSDGHGGGGLEAACHIDILPYLYADKTVAAVQGLELRRRIARNVASVGGIEQSLVHPGVVIDDTAFSFHVAVHERKMCAWCNARIVARAGNASSVGGSADGDARPAQAQMCQACWKWHCASCCAHSVSIAATDGQGRAAGVRCCARCRKAVDARQRQRSQAPAALPECTRRLLAAHAALSAAMAEAAARMRELEALSRLPRRHLDWGEELPEERLSAISESQARTVAAVTKAKASVIAATQQIGGIDCPPLPHHDARLRAALMQHAQQVVEDVQLRLSSSRPHLLRAPSPDRATTLSVQ